MKKILLGTTAVIALGAISTEAFAADKIQLGLGGFMRHYVGVVSDDEAANGASDNSNRAVGFNQNSNTEVYFSGSTTLDNGLTVAAKMELEADGEATGNSTDASFLTISSDAMGALTLGTTTHASDDFDVNAPNAGNFGYGDLDDWAQMAATSAGNNQAFSFVARRDWNGGNANKIKYVTPTFSGVTGFASYTTSTDGASNHLAEDRDTTNDSSSIGIAYSGDVSGVAVKADLSETRLNGVNKNTHVGLSVGMSGFTIAGSYVKTKDDDGSATNNVATGSTAADSGQAFGDGTEWDIGVAYETGPYSVSASYLAAKNDDTTTTAGDSKDRAWRVAGTYDLGAGVALSATYFNLKRDGEDTGAATTYANGKSAKVSGVIAGIEVGF